MNKYTFSRCMEYTATAFLYQTVEGNTPQEAYEKLQESNWEFNEEPSLDEEQCVQVDSTEISKVNGRALWEDALDELDREQAQLWNEASDDLEC